ncbi:MAG: glycosyltransferase family 4 protein [Betaproteobacteria bacterium]
MRVYVDTVRWFCRPRNTDWQYNFVLAELSRFVPSLEMFYPRDVAQLVRVNLAYCRDNLRYRMSKLGGSALREWTTYSDRLCVGELQASACDVVFSHRDFPSNAGAVPVIWQNSILDPQMAIARGISRDEIKSETSIKRKLFARSARVQVSTMAEAARLGEWMPELADRFVAVPFFLPYLDSAGATALEKHRDPEKVHFVFIGREARRKGLPEVLAALTSLNFGARRDWMLTIVSDFRDGRVELPDWGNLHHRDNLARSEVIALLDAAHVLLVPSRFESYGFIYLEAMSRATVPVVPDWEVQREIVDNGKCGVVVKPDPARIAAAVETLATDGAMRSGLAAAATRRFDGEYAPAAVAARYARMFESVR